MTKQKVMALGFFDGIHVGHAALINKIKQRAEETGAEPAVLTFDVHPDNLVFKKNRAAYQQRRRQREHTQPLLWHRRCRCYPL